MGAPDMDELSFTDSELDFHVNNALKAFIQGDCDFYNQLVVVIHHKERLVAEEDSANTVWRRLLSISRLWPPQSASYFMESLKQPKGLTRKTQVLDRVHSTLKNISNVVLLSPLRLEKIVREGMPNVYTKEPIIVTYVENMLRLESGEMSELVRSMILVTLSDRLVELDDDFHKGMFFMELEDLEGRTDHVEQDSNEILSMPNFLPREHH